MDKVFYLLLVVYSLITTFSLWRQSMRAIKKASYLSRKLQEFATEANIYYSNREIQGGDWKQLYVDTWTLYQRKISEADNFIQQNLTINERNN